jgi:flagellar hook-associated protein 2
MAGINVSNFFSNSFDWQAVVDKLMEVSATPKVKLEQEQAANTGRLAALADIKDAMFELQESVRMMWDNNLYSARTVTADVANSTWRANSSAGATIGSYQLSVSQLAAAGRIQGAGDIGAGLAGTTLATLNTATAVMGGTFTINGKQVTISTADSMAQVLAAIGTATGGSVTAAYDAGADKVVLASATPLMVGAANDTSNFLTAMGLSNNVAFSNGTYTVVSRATLGTVRQNGPLQDAALRTALTGTGSFSINGVSLAYDAAVDSLADVLKRINLSSAGVVASYDADNDRVTLVNGKTGDYGINLSEDTPGFLAALGLTGGGAIFTAGQDARFSVNGGASRSSASNTLDAAALGITGLSVTVNSEATQTLEIATDTNMLESAIQGFIGKYNAVQALIEGHTTVSSEGGIITASVLAGNREVEAWSTQIRALAFNTVSSATGTIRRLNDLGLDFSGTANELVIKDGTRLANALLDHPTEVASFFQTGTGSFTARMYNYLTAAIKADGEAQSRLSLTNSGINTQVADIQRRLDNERELLTASFLKMQDAQSRAQSQNTYLTNTFFKSSSN